MLPVLDKTISHISAEQDGIARIRKIVDERYEFFIHVPGHPVQLTLWACNKAINGDLHLQFEFPHYSSVVNEYSSCVNSLTFLLRCVHAFVVSGDRPTP